MIHRQHFGADLTELPICEEPITIQVWRGFSSTVMEGYDECEVFKKMEELTNVKIDWIYPPVGSETDNFNMRCMSYDLPHMFSTPPEYNGGVEKAVKRKSTWLIPSTTIRAWPPTSSTCAIRIPTSLRTR